MLVLDPRRMAQLAAQHTGGHITHREFALDVVELARQEHPFLATIPAVEILAVVEHLPSKVRVALDTIDPMELARQLADWPEALTQETIYPLIPTLLLVAQPDTSSAGSRYSAWLRGCNGRIVTDFMGPWSARSLGALLAIGLDKAASLEAYEAEQAAAART